MITYILKAIIFSAFLLLIYRLFLENEKMHSFNRFYLLLSIALPLIVPLIAIPAISLMPQIPGSINTTVIGQASPIISDSQVPATNMAESDPAVTGLQKKISQPASTSGKERNLWLMFLVTGYLTVTLVLLYRFITNILSIYLTIKNNKSVPYHYGTIVLTKDILIPHSFLKYIFVNRNDFERGRIEKEILAHELTHVRQYHSLDILFAEFIMVFGWINPLLFFCRKAIRLNHEFLADRSVIEAFSDTQAYQLLLFEKVRQTKSRSLSSPFNYLQTKKRLKMMSKNKSPKAAILKQFAIIPLIAVAGLLFTAKGCSEDLTGTLEQQHANTGQAGESNWQLVSRKDESGNEFNEIIGVFEGTKDDNDITEAPLKVKIFVTKRKGGELFTEFYESGSETPSNLHKRTNSFFNYNTQSTVDIKVNLSYGEIIDMEQTLGGSHMWDFYTKIVPPPPDAPEGLRYGEPRIGDLLNLILEQDEKMNVMVDFRSIEEFNNKIYRFDINPDGLKELFSKL